mgnify:CR=1 FL=1
MFQISKVEKITGLTRRQLQYWNKTGLLEPASASEGQRKPNLWSFTNMVALRAIRRLLDQNVSLQKIRKVLDYAKKTWPDLGNHLNELTFYVLYDGKEVLLLGPDETFPVSALRAQGQKVFVLPGQEVTNEVTRAIDRIYDKPLTPGEAEDSSKAWSDYLAGTDRGETLEQVRQIISTNQEKDFA